ncbi:MAG: PAS domain S-box protein [Myxococcales bacterium]
MATRQSPGLPDLAAEPVALADELSRAYSEIAELRAALTLRERQLRAERENEARLIDTLEHSNVGTWEWNVRTNEGTWSSTIQRIFGISEGTVEPSYESWLAMVHPEDRTSAVSNLRAALAGDADLVCQDYRCVRPDGSIRWLAARGYVIRDMEGVPLWVRGVVFDMSTQRAAEEALREQAMLLEHMSKGVSVADDQGTIIYANPAEELMFGYERGEMLGLPSRAKSAPEDDWRVPHVTEELRARGVWSGQWRNVRKDGSRFHTQVQLLALQRGGRPHWLCVQEDISEQIETRARADSLTERLADQERHLRVITDIIPAMVGYVDTDLRYRFVNRAYQRWFGVDPTTVIGKHMRELQGERTFARARPYLERALAGEASCYERDFKTADGSVHRLQPHYVPDRDDAGNIRGVAVLVLDITEQRRTEQALKAERERLQKVLLAAPAAISVRSGPDLVYTLTNPAYRELFGVDNLLGKGARQLPMLVQQGYIDLLEQVYRTGQSENREEAPLVFEDAEGNPVQRFFNLTYQPMHDMNGAVDSVVSFGVEVTAIVEARRRAEAASRAKDAFLALLGHELRNPLAPILTAVQLMKLRNPTANEKERGVIERHVRHMMRLVDDLLDVSRITRGKISLERERVDLMSCMSTAIESAMPLIEQRDHRLTFAFSGTLQVEGDSTRLRQVFANLLNNAAKYTPAGGDIEIGGKVVDGQAHVWVRDNGVGLRAEIMPFVFDLFVQEQQNLDRADGGLGLGLAIVRSLVTLHGGSVEAQSAGQGKGSTFIVMLPLAADQSAQAVRTSSAPPHSEKQHQILIVDDNNDAASTLAAALSHLGHRVEIAHDGHAALAKLEEFVPDLALLDIGLPQMDGYELARRVRAHPKAPGLKLVALTGYGDERSLNRAREAGFDRHLVKPVDLGALVRLMLELNGARSLRPKT